MTLSSLLDGDKGFLTTLLLTGIETMLGTWFDLKFMIVQGFFTMVWMVFILLLVTVKEMMHDEKFLKSLDY